MGERLFGVFFASANLLVQRQEIVRFLLLKVGRAEEEGSGWWGSLLEWVQSVECELFLSQNTVAHAACVCVIRMLALCVCDLCVRAMCVCQRAAQSVSVFAARWVCDAVSGSGLRFQVGD